MILNLSISDDDTIFHTDDISELSDTLNNRKNLYTDDLRDRWKDIEPEYEVTKEKEKILIIEGHEVMAEFEKPYMKKLAEIVTRNGGDVLNVGYGLGIIDNYIEQYRKDRFLKNHYIIELNKKLAEEARKMKNVKVLNGDWVDKIEEFEQCSLDGIIYDAYPLSFDEVHRDSIPFIEAIAKNKVLKEGGIFTFYTDVAEEFGNNFIQFLDTVGLKLLEVEKIPISEPDRLRQGWRYDHFLAPIVTYA